MDVWMQSAMRSNSISILVMGCILRGACAHQGSYAKAVAYVGVICNGKSYWGVGIDADIIKASVEALTVAVNKIEEIIKRSQQFQDERIIEILNYIQTNYLSVTLDVIFLRSFI